MSRKVSRSEPLAIAHERQTALLCAHESGEFGAQLGNLFQGALSGGGATIPPPVNETTKAGEGQLRGEVAPHFSRLIAATTND